MTDRLRRPAVPTALPAALSVTEHRGERSPASPVAREARAHAQDEPLASLETEVARRHGVPTRVATVMAVDDLGPDLRELTFGNVRGHHALGPDDYFLVIRPKPGREHQLDGDVSFERFQDLPPADIPDRAYYTCRRWRPEVGELDVWFVLHDHDGAISGWARHAAVGDRVALWGPRSSFEPPDGTTSLLLVGDETGLAAFAAILEATASSVPVTMVVETDHGRPLVEISDRPGADLHWLDRDGSARGTGTTLVDAVADLEVDPRGLYAFGAGESRQITAVRRHLRHERGMPGQQVQMIPYWRRGS